MAPPPLTKRLIGVSLKMYFDFHQTQEYIASLHGSSAFLDAAEHSERSDTTIFIVPSFPALPTVSLLSSTWLGAQDCHFKDRGPYTGETSPLMLQQLGCKIVELGHAERRRAPTNETDNMVGAKARAAVRNNMIPLICIGEKDRSHIASEAVGIAIEQCKPQIMVPLHALQESPGQNTNAGVVFAYEPVWAIGASEPASADHVLAVITALRPVVKYAGYKGEVRFLYGGSAGPGTWDKLKSGCDGLFLGRFAHDVENFVRVLEEVAMT